MVKSFIHVIVFYTILNQYIAIVINMIFTGENVIVLAITKETRFNKHLHLLTRREDFSGY